MEPSGQRKSLKNMISVQTNENRYIINEVSLNTNTRNSAIPVQVPKVMKELKPGELDMNEISNNSSRLIIPKSRHSICQLDIPIESFEKSNKNEKLERNDKSERLKTQIQKIEYRFEQSKQDEYDKDLDNPFSKSQTKFTNPNIDSNKGISPNMSIKNKPNSKTRGSNLKAFKTYVQPETELKKNQAKYGLNVKSLIPETKTTDFERKLSRQKKVLDSNPEDSENSQDDMTLYQKDKESPFLIEHDSKKLFNWNIHMIVLVMYSVIASPIYLAFGGDSTILLVTITMYIDFFFCIDFILQFFITFVNHDDMTVRDFRMIAYNYIFGWFLFDLVAAVPIGSSIELIMFLSDNDVSNDINLSGAINKSLKFVKIYRIIKFSSMIRVFKLSEEKTNNKKNYKKSNLFEELNISNSVKRLIKFILVFLLLTHVMSCVWIFVGSLDFPNWIYLIRLQDSDPTTIYVSAFYYLIATIFTIGYGDIGPKNMYEIIFTLFTEFFGVLIFSYFVSSLGNILSSHDNMTSKYMKKLEVLNETKFKYDLDDDIFDKVMRHINYDYRFNKYERYTFLSEIPIRMRRELLEHIYKDIINNFKFFKQYRDNQEFISSVVLALKPNELYRNDIIIQESDYVQELIMVKSGLLTIHLGYKFNEEKIMNIKRTEHFGDINIMAKQRSQINLKVASKVADLLIIKRTDFENIMEDHLEVCKKILLISSYNYMKMLEVIKEKILKLKNEKEVNFNENEHDKEKEEEMNEYFNNLNEKIEEVNGQKVVIQHLTDHVNEGLNIKNFNAVTFLKSLTLRMNSRSIINNDNETLKRPESGVFKSRFSLRKENFKNENELDKINLTGPLPKLRSDSLEGKPDKVSFSKAFISGKEPVSHHSNINFDFHHIKDAKKLYGNEINLSGLINKFEEKKQTSEKLITPNSKFPIQLRNISGKIAKDHKLDEKLSQSDNKDFAKEKDKEKKIFKKISINIKNKSSNLKPPNYLSDDQTHIQITAINRKTRISNGKFKDSSISEEEDRLKQENSFEEAKENDKLSRNSKTQINYDAFRELNSTNNEYTNKNNGNTLMNNYLFSKKTSNGNQPKIGDLYDSGGTACKEEVNELNSSMNQEITLIPKVLTQSKILANHDINNKEEGNKSKRDKKKAKQYHSRQTLKLLNRIKILERKANISTKSIKKSEHHLLKTINSKFVDKEANKNNKIKEENKDKLKDSYKESHRVNGSYTELARQSVDHKGNINHANNSDVIKNAYIERTKSNDFIEEIGLNSRSKRFSYVMSIIQAHNEIKETKKETKKEMRRQFNKLYKNALGLVKGKNQIDILIKFQEIFKADNEIFDDASDSSIDEIDNDDDFSNN